MSRFRPSPGAAIAAAWERLSPLPGGKRLFSWRVGRMAPYTATLGARVEALGPGSCRVELPDRRRVRNHLESVHAMALANLGELCTGLATLVALGGEVRGILRGFEIDYVAKARGRLVATCETSPPAVTGPVDHRACAEIRDAAGTVVATVAATWRLDRRSPRA